MITSSSLAQTYVLSPYVATNPISSNSIGFQAGRSAGEAVATRETSATENRPTSQGPNNAATSPADPNANTLAEPTSSAARAEKENSVADEREKQQLLKDQRLIAELSARDREVRAHEQAHAAVGGQYAGAPSYQYERGPDGVSYAVGGEVPIDVGKAATPQETILKAQIVRRAALAPAEPSPQDRKVAAQASQLEAQARVELRTEQLDSAEDSSTIAVEEVGAGSDSVSSAGGTASSTPVSQVPSSAVSSPTDNANTLGSRSAQFLAISVIESSRSGSRLDQVA